MKKFVFYVISMILLISCTDGKWKDNIGLSTSNVEMTKGIDSITISTEGDWWWIYQITFNDSIFTYLNRDDINLESESYLIEELNFTVERRDKNTLYVRLDENKTDNDRIMVISLQAGDYFDYIHIKQQHD